MKELTSNSKPSIVTDREITDVETHFNIRFPAYYVKFLKKHGGTSTKEVVFTNKFWVNFFLPLTSEVNASIKTSIEGHRANYNDNNWLPFAIDSGGWTFCIALKDEIKNQVWVDKFDNGDDSPFEFVASSFEEFINNLRTEEDAFSSDRIGDELLGETSDMSIDFTSPKKYSNGLICFEGDKFEVSEQFIKRMLYNREIASLNSAYQRDLIKIIELFNNSHQMIYKTEIIKTKEEFVEKFLRDQYGFITLDAELEH